MAFATSTESHGSVESVKYGRDAGQGQPLLAEGKFRPAKELRVEMTTSTPALPKPICLPPLNTPRTLLAISTIPSRMSSGSEGNFAASRAFSSAGAGYSAFRMVKRSMKA